MIQSTYLAAAVIVAAFMVATAVAQSSRAFAVAAFPVAELFVGDADNTTTTAVPAPNSPFSVAQKFGISAATFACVAFLWNLFCFFLSRPYQPAAVASASDVPAPQVAYAPGSAGPNKI